MDADAFDPGAILTPEHIEQFAAVMPLDLLRSYQARDYPPVAHWLRQFREPPPTIRTFVESRRYLGLQVGATQQADVWPGIVDILVEAVEGEFREVVLTGAIGYGKSILSDILEAYDACRVLCLTDPPKTYGLATGTGLVMILQSLNARLAKRVLFQPLKNLLRRSPFFAQFPVVKRIESEILFRDVNFRITPVAGNEQAAIGENVAFATLDEVNFFNVVVGSKKAHGAKEYDAARANLIAITRRMRSRFLRLGKMPCRVIIVSSSRYPEDLTEQKADEARSDPGILIVRRSQWDTKPRAFFLPGNFQLAVGGQFSRTHILLPGEPLPTDQRVIDVPDDFRSDFEKDPDGALRDVAGIPTMTIRPFLVRRELVEACCVLGPDGHPFSQQETTLRDACQILRDRLHWKVPADRAAHMDLAVRNDAAGLCIGYAAGMKRVERTALEVAQAESLGRTLQVVELPNRRVYFEDLPIIVIEAMLRIVAPPGDEIILAQVADLVLALRRMGLPIKYATADSYQSVSPIQTLWAAGMSTGQISCDRTMTPYNDLKQAIYDGRLQMYWYPTALRELLALEKNEKTGKVDHPEWSRDLEGHRVKGSKDVADGMAGCVHILSRRSESWYQPPTEVVTEQEHLTVNDDGTVTTVIKLDS